eukprot:9150989-Prorocentrum_lima.AAC.1
MASGQAANFCPMREPLLTPEGLPLQPVVERKMKRHSCLYAAFATFLGFHGEANPVSKVKRHCARELEAGSDYYSGRWDGLSGDGQSSPEWD